MSKYLTVFTISWQNEFIYRTNFILWRFRNILRFLMTYFLWSGIFLSTNSVFGYTPPMMFTYVFMVMAVSTIILSSPSSDRIGGEIANGDLSNYLVKPISYLKYWFARDLSSKLLNMLFAAIEISFLWIILRPSIEVSSNAINFIAGALIIFVAVILYYLVNIAARLVTFWTPENTWGVAFVLLVFLEVLAGGIFPLDILPKWAYIAIQFTPFPYLLYFPIAIFIGKIEGFEVIRILIQSTIWLVIMLYVTKLIWRKGLKVYSSEGR